MFLDFRFFSSLTNFIDLTSVPVLPPFKIFLSLASKFTFPKKTLNCGFTAFSSSKVNRDGNYMFRSGAVPLCNNDLYRECRGNYSKYDSLLQLLIEAMV
jgi:hypothetical protein